MTSVVIPAYNEEDAIAETVQACQRELPKTGQPYETLVVDDGSSDKTAEIAVAAGARVIRHLNNLGYGRSLKDGIRAATYDTIVITDADGTYPIDQIPSLVEIYREGFNMVVGARQGKNYSESINKGALRFILKHLVEFTAGRKIPDINSGLRIFSRREAVPYFSYLGDAFSFTTSITLAYMMNGMFIKYHSDQVREANRKNKGSPFQGFAPDTAVYRGGDSLFQPAEDIPCLLRCHARPFCDLFCRRLNVRTLHRISAGCWRHPLVIPHVWDGTGFNPTQADNYVSAKTGRRGPSERR